MWEYFIMEIKALIKLEIKFDRGLLHFCIYIASFVPKALSEELL